MLLGSVSEDRAASEGRHLSERCWLDCFAELRTAGRPLW